MDREYEIQYIVQYKVDLKVIILAKCCVNFWTAMYSTCTSVMLDKLDMR